MKLFVVCAAFALCFAGSAVLADGGNMAAVPADRLDNPPWAARHQAKLSEIATVHPEVIFIGDSITQRWERADTKPVWQYFYGDRHAVDLGFGGDTTANVLWRLQNGEIDGIAPKVAVLLIGTNNLGKPWTVQDDVAGIDADIAEIHNRLPQTNILLLALLPRVQRSEIIAKLDAVNRALAAAYAHSNFVRYLDVGPVLLKDGAPDPSLYADPNYNPPGLPLHPNGEGMRRIAAAMEPVLAAMLNEPPKQ